MRQTHRQSTGVQAPLGCPCTSRLSTGFYCCELFIRENCQYKEAMRPRFSNFPPNFSITSVCHFFPPGTPLIKLRRMEGDFVRWRSIHPLPSEKITGQAEQDRGRISLKRFHSRVIDPRTKW